MTTLAASLMYRFTDHNYSLITNDDHSAGKRRSVFNQRVGKWTEGWFFHEDAAVTGNRRKCCQKSLHKKWLTTIDSNLTSHRKSESTEKFRQQCKLCLEKTTPTFSSPSWQTAIGKRFALGDPWETRSRRKIESTTSECAISLAVAMKRHI